MRDDPQAGGDDRALVEALGHEARRLAAEDDRGGPSAAAWYRLARTRREQAIQAEGRRGIWRASLRAGAAAALVALVAGLVGGGIVVFRRRQAPTSAEVLASGATAPAAAPALSFSVEGSTVTRGDQIDVVGSSNAAVRFSDGTQVGLEEGARLAVTARDAHGARMRLQSGRARFQVVHLPAAAWSVDAGPYLIEVTGTVFAVRWSESERTIEIAMQSGSVRVSGPLLSERMVLRAGQRLLVRSKAGDVELDQLDQIDGRSAGAPAPVGEGAARSDATEAATPSVAPTRAEAPDVRRRPRGELALASPRASEPSSSSAHPLRDGARPAPERGPSDEPSGRVGPLGRAMVEPPPFERLVPPERAESAAPPPVEAPPAPRERAVNGAGEGPARWTSRGWSGRVASGEAQAVLAEAEHVGFEATLAGADGADLSAFADAARYAGRPDLADRALIETRRRFPGSARAQAAAFLLGRAADDRGDTSSGLVWFRRYLLDAPQGPFASEALGRQMIAVEKLRGRPAAAPLAAEYLRRFPNGTYLLRARALLVDR